MKPSSVAVIISTYNSPRWLEKVLWGYAAQDETRFEIVIADDGSTEETRELVERIRQETDLRIRHIWHEDDGFRKTIILNRAIVAAAADYLIISDGDCVPRADFVRAHVQNAQPGRFLSGGYFKLPMDISEQIEREDIVTGRFSELHWLRAQGLPRSRQEWKIRPRGAWAAILDRLTPTQPTWNGANSSAWKSDIVAVNGFDERMQYGGLDRELGERLENAGVRGVQLRHRAVCLHLDHGRPYSRPEIWAKNKAIRREVREQKRVWTDFGIEKTSTTAPSTPAFAE